MLTWPRMERFVEVERGTVWKGSLRMVAAPYRCSAPYRNFVAHHTETLSMPRWRNLLNTPLFGAPKGHPKPAQGNALG